MAQIRQQNGLFIGLVVETPKQPEIAEKPLARMNTAELEEYANIKGIDISDCGTNRERIAKLQ